MRGIKDRTVLYDQMRERGRKLITSQVLADAYCKLQELATVTIEGREDWRVIPGRNGSAPTIEEVVEVSRHAAKNMTKALLEAGLLESSSGPIPSSVETRRKGPWFEVRVRVGVSPEQALRILQGEPANVVLANPSAELPTDLDTQVRELVEQVTALLKERESHLARIAELEQADRQHIADKVATAKQSSEAAGALQAQQDRIAELEKELKDLRNSGARHPGLDQVLKQLRAL